ncbi:MAG: hypothetical protein IH946_13005 [Bacteroidetes bacterium]|nr:hypothetical protein [Bacteroidota bacterium]
MKDWFHFLDEGLKWAKDMGCSHVETAAREGFEHYLDDWEPVWVVYRKRL